MKNFLNKPCPKCTNINLFVNAGELPEKIDNCLTCENNGFISEEHSNLFDLGFCEIENSHDYRMYLNKILNPLQTLEVTVTRVKNNFIIAHSGGNGPYLMSILNEIGTDSVKPLITFLARN